ncbi:MAG: hypothetical protein AABX99_01905 [Nanoarchaeota archaeon]
MKTLKDLTKGDYIAFGFNYNGGEPNEIIVDNITNVYRGKVLVHFLRGGMFNYQSQAELVKKKDILAIGNNETGEGTIKGWGGKYDILHPRKLKQILERK